MMVSASFDSLFDTASVPYMISSKLDALSSRSQVGESGVSLLLSRIGTRFLQREASFEKEKPKQRR